MAVLFYFGAIAGILFSVSLFKYIKGAKALLWLGQNTLTYYAFHKTIFVICKMRLNIQNWIITMVITMAILVPISLFINKYIPFLVGKKQHSK